MSDRTAALQARLLATFRIEADEQLRALRGELDAVRGDPDLERIRGRLEAAFRATHTLKGAARSVGLTAFEAVCQRCEALLSELIESAGVPEIASVEIVAEASDALAGFVAGRLAEADLAAIGDNPAVVGPLAGGTRPAPESELAAVAPVIASAKTIRVDVEQLDRLTSLSEHLLGPKLAALAQVEQAREIVNELSAIRARLPAEALQIRDELRSLEARTRRFITNLRDSSKALRTGVDDLYEEMRRARMMPAASIFEAFPLMVRDLCRETGKDVAWEVVGATLEVDRKVLDLVKDPLVHVVRNSIDHGIEPPEVREAAGKARRGRITVTIAPVEGGRISIEVTDDGRGFAIDSIRDAAIRARLASPEQLAALDDAQITELAFQAGLSTSPVVTSISGHGRGLAIVRERIEQVEGRVSTRSTPGAGASIRLELPASIVTYRALLMRASDVPLLIPLDAVERTFMLPRARADAALQQRALVVDGLMLPCARLGAILRLPETPLPHDQPSVPCVVVESGGQHGALLVEHIVGESEIVLKDFEPPLRRINNVLASGLLGTGDLVLVLRPLDLLLSMHLEPSPIAAAPTTLRPAPRVLVVDDSITTRMMERNLFEAAGYAVRAAADGIDAWEILQNEEIDVIVSDVDMPRMDGFELTERVRSNPRLAELPVVLVTALEAREDKERGIRVGANAYVLKSGFNQAHLLDIVRRLA